MAPCSHNVITPTMIRRGEIQIGDKIEFEDIPASAPAPAPTAAEEPVYVSAAPGEATGEASVEVSAEAAVPAASTTISEAVPQAPASQNDTSTSYIGGGAQGAHQDSYRTFQTNTASIPLIYQNMTDYVNSLQNTGQQSPSFSVPSSPLVPPEYEQTIDYDSVQYMNGFLRTQIGRYMRVEQLIGSDSTEDRYGFLVGVGNNYLLLQDISNGNVAIVDLYSIKYVYMHFGEPVFPNIPFGPTTR